MKSFGFTIITLLVIGILGYGGYFALVHLTDPKDYIPATYEKIGDLHRSKTETATIPVAVLVPELETPPTTTASQTTTSPVVADEKLSDRIQKIITSKIILKKGSKGIAVGTIQEFMNKYFAKNLKIDNDFGKTLEADVKKFQTQNKITVTGQVGTATLQAMLTWAKNH